MADNRGSIVRQGNFLRINQAFVEEVNFFSRNTGYIIVSYSAPMPNGMTSIEQLRLNVTNSTIILNQFNMPMCFCDIRQGMWIDVTFSSAMTRSIPPQSNAFMIVARRAAQQPSTSTSTGRIVRVDANQNFLYASRPDNLSSLTRYVITNSTVILNRNGIPVSLRSLRPGQLVRITHSTAQTASIPPQTTAFRIQLL